MLEREEYIEQAYFFRQLLARVVQDNVPIQEVFVGVRQEILATTKLPMAIDFLLSELKHQGVFGPAMARLSHYFSPFQTFLITSAEAEQGRFDFRMALEILAREAEYLAQGGAPQAIFLFQFECLARNRLSYDKGLKAVADDPRFDGAWRDWILMVRREVGLIDLADLIYVRSQYHVIRESKRMGEPYILPPDKPALFGEKEGRIALANRQKDPLYLFAALQRHLNYPEVPRPKPADPQEQQLPNLLRRLDNMEMRLKLVEEEGKGGLDLTKFYGPDAPGG
jgi:hypothetical protein